VAHSDPSHYFSTGNAGDAPPSRPRTTEVAVDGRTLACTTDSGVFATAGLDQGTGVLLDRGARPAPGARDLLDLGCGWGPVALALAVRAPGATVWAVDTNRRAVALCAANAEANGLGNIRAVAVDPDTPLGGLDEAAGVDVTVDGVWSNPPVRIGKKALHELLLGALRRIRPGGQAHLVVHKHLGSDSLAAWLGAQGYPTSRRASRFGYRLLDVDTPPGGDDEGG
jgi:16S rRNA (guanine1207-N2)-methyltransferase